MPRITDMYGGLPNEMSSLLSHWKAESLNCFPTSRLMSNLNFPLHGLDFVLRYLYLVQTLDNGSYICKNIGFDLWFKIFRIYILNYSMFASWYICIRPSAQCTLTQSPLITSAYYKLISLLLAILLYVSYQLNVYLGK